MYGNVVIRREDVEKYGMNILFDSKVHRIHDNSFRDNQHIEGELVIPTNITKLGMFSFSNCKCLTKVIIPSSVKEIPYCCFEHCKQLKEVELPKDIVLEPKCFWECPLLKEIVKEEEHGEEDKEEIKSNCSIC